MEQVLRSLLSETRSRCLALAEVIVARDVHELVAPLAVKAVRTFRELAREAENTLSDPALSQSLLHPEFFQVQRRLAERQTYFETVLVPLVLTFDERDARMTQAARGMGAAVGYADANLVIKAQASGSPFTIPAFRTIWVPTSDIESALGWPDILHELGHIILTDHPEILDGFGSQVTTLLEDEIRELRGRQVPTDMVQRTRLVYASWILWAREFGADLLATWFLGPAYLWANLRLCARLHRDVFRPSFEDLRAGTHSHPADHARMLLCSELCRRLGVEPEAMQALDAWETYVRVRQLTEPQGFANCYPRALQQLLVQGVEVSARTIGLIPCANANETVQYLQKLYQAFGTDAAEMNRAEERFRSLLGV